MHVDMSSNPRAPPAFPMFIPRLIAVGAVQISQDTLNTLRQRQLISAARFRRKLLQRSSRWTYGTTMTCPLVLGIGVQDDVAVPGAMDNQGLLSSSLTFGASQKMHPVALPAAVI